MILPLSKNDSLYGFICSSFNFNERRITVPNIEFNSMDEYDIEYSISNVNNFRVIDKPLVTLIDADDVSTITGEPLLIVIDKAESVSERCKSSCMLIV